MEQKYDFNLHVHSVYSDGNYTFPELVQILKSKGLQGFAITDHNCAGPLDELEQLTEQAGIALIKGVELKASIQPLLDEEGIENPTHDDGSTEYESIEEVICYGLDPDNEEFKADSAEHLRTKEPYLRTICEMIADVRVGEIDGLQDHPRRDEKLGILFPRIYEKKLAAFKGHPPADGLMYLGTTEIMSYLVKEFGLDKPSAKVFTMKYTNQVLKILGIDKTDPFYGTDIREIVRKAKRWGKVAVLAHPLTKKRKNLVQIYRRVILPELIKAGLDGVECSYMEHKEPEEEIVRSWQDEFGLKILTGGSDFHKEKDIPNLRKFGVNHDTWDLLRELIS